MFHVEIQNRATGEWRPAIVTGSVEPYSWTTREEAERAMRTFWPDQARLGESGGVRVVFSYGGAP